MTAGVGRVAAPFWLAVLKPETVTRRPLPRRVSTVHWTTPLPFSAGPWVILTFVPSGWVMTSAPVKPEALAPLDTLSWTRDVPLPSSSTAYPYDPSPPREAIGIPTGTSSDSRASAALRSFSAVPGSDPCGTGSGSAAGRSFSAGCQTGEVTRVFNWALSRGGLGRETGASFSAGAFHSEASTRKPVGVTSTARQHLVSTRRSGYSYPLKTSSFEPSGSRSVRQSS